MITQEDISEMATSKLYLLSYSPFFKTLLLDLSDNNRKQAHFNTVDNQTDIVDRVGFEPTTAAKLYPCRLSIESLSAPTQPTLDYLRFCRYTGKR